MSEEKKHKILQLAERLGALTFGDYLLSSGEKSKYYFDGRILTLNPEGAYLIGETILEEVYDCSAEAIGGPTLGADPIVSAVILTSYLKGSFVEGFLIRSSAKDHGREQIIEGSLSGKKAESHKLRVVIVDDVCTSGGSLMHSISAVEAQGCEVVRVVVILDRLQGGSEAIRNSGYCFVPLLVASPQGSVTIA